jgi:hypothetical protein
MEQRLNFQPEPEVINMDAFERIRQTDVRRRTAGPSLWTFSPQIFSTPQQISTAPAIADRGGITFRLRTVASRHRRHRRDGVMAQRDRLPPAAV